MNYKLATTLYILIILAFLQSWSVITIAAVLLFSFIYNPVLLIPAAIIVDGYFGNYYGVPVLSIVSVIWFVFVELFKPTLVSLRSK